MTLAKSILPHVHQLIGGRVSKKIFFLHVHKSGGTSVTEGLKNSFGLTETISKRHFFTLDNDASAIASEIVGEDIRSYREKLLLYYMSMERMKYISGHFYYSEKAMQKFGKEWSFITLLRHPIDRWFSTYFFDRYREGSSNGRIDCDLESFVESERALRLGSGYVLAFTEGISLSEVSSNDAINCAIKNLKKFALVGVLEEIDVFARAYKALFGAELFIQRLNKNPLSRQKQTGLISDKIQKKVEEICQPSMKIYEAIQGEINVSGRAL